MRCTQCNRVFLFLKGLFLPHNFTFPSKVYWGSILIYVLFLKQIQINDTFRRKSPQSINQAIKQAIKQALSNCRRNTYLTATICSVVQAYPYSLCFSDDKRRELPTCRSKSHDSSIACLVSPIHCYKSPGLEFPSEVYVQHFSFNTHSLTVTWLDFYSGATLPIRTFESYRMTHNTIENESRDCQDMRGFHCVFMKSCVLYRAKITTEWPQNDHRMTTEWPQNNHRMTTE